MDVDHFEAVVSVRFLTSLSMQICYVACGRSKTIPLGIDINTLQTSFPIETAFVNRIERSSMTRFLKML